MKGRAVSLPHLVRDMTVTSLALVFSFWALAGTGYQAIYYGIFAFFLGIPVYIWMKAQRGEYGESPVVPIDYPLGSPYAVKAGYGNGHTANAEVAARRSEAAATHAEVPS